MGVLARHLARADMTVSGADAARIRLAFLDTCACIALAWDGPVAAHVARSQRQLKNQGLAAQAMVWGAAAHALDFDDYEPFGSTHPSAVLVPVVLALADGASMEQAITAYAQGYHTISVLGKMLGYGHYQAGWHATSTLGTLGAARVGAALLGLSEAQTRTALAIAASRAGGLKAQFGSQTKPLHAGFAAAAGLEAAVLAQNGISAGAQALDGADGFAGVFGPVESAFTSDVAQIEFADNPLFSKPWPCCAYTHRAIEAAIRLKAEHGFEAAQISAIVLEIAAPYLQVARHRAPKDAEQARFSVSYCVAASLAQGALLPASTTADCLNRADITRLEAMVDPRPYPLPRGAGDMSPDAPDTLTVTLHDGRQVSTCVRNAKGGPAKPMTRQDKIDKFLLSGGSQAQAEAFLDAPGDAPFFATLFPKADLT